MPPTPTQATTQKNPAPPRGHTGTGGLLPEELMYHCLDFLPASSYLPFSLTHSFYQALVKRWLHQRLRQAMYRRSPTSLWQFLWQAEGDTDTAVYGRYFQQVFNTGLTYQSLTGSVYPEIYQTMTASAHPFYRINRAYLHQWPPEDLQRRLKEALKCWQSISRGDQLLTIAEYSQLRDGLNRSVTDHMTWLQSNSRGPLAFISQMESLLAFIALRKNSPQELPGHTDQLLQQSWSIGFSWLARIDWLARLDPSALITLMTRFRLSFYHFLCVTQDYFPDNRQSLWTCYLDRLTDQSFQKIIRQHPWDAFHFARVIADTNHFPVHLHIETLLPLFGYENYNAFRLGTTPVILNRLLQSPNQLLGLLEHPGVNWYECFNHPIFPGFLAQNVLPHIQGSVRAFRSMIDNLKQGFFPHWSLPNLLQSLDYLRCLIIERQTVGCNLPVGIRDLNLRRVHCDQLLSQFIRNENLIHYLIHEAPYFNPNRANPLSVILNEVDRYQKVVELFQPDHPFNQALREHPALLSLVAPLPQFKGAIVDYMAHYSEASLIHYLQTAHPSHFGGQMIQAVFNQPGFMARCPEWVLLRALRGFKAYGQQLMPHGSRRRPRAQPQNPVLAHMPWRQRLDPGLSKRLMTKGLLDPEELLKWIHEADKLPDLAYMFALCRHDRVRLNLMRLNQAYSQQMPEDAKRFLLDSRDMTPADEVELADWAEVYAAKAHRIHQLLNDQVIPAFDSNRLYGWWNRSTLSAIRQGLLPQLRSMADLYCQLGEDREANKDVILNWLRERYQVDEMSDWNRFQIVAAWNRETAHLRRMFQAIAPDLKRHPNPIVNGAVEFIEWAINLLVQCFGSPTHALTSRIQPSFTQQVEQAKHEFTGWPSTRPRLA